MAFSSVMKFKTKTLHYKTALVVFGCLLLLESAQKAFCETYTINTNNPPTISSSSVLIPGIIQNKTFKGPNGESWDHDVAIFNIPQDKKYIFSDGKPVIVNGNNSLSINTTGDLTISKDLDVSGQEVTDEDTSVFLLGGFVRRSNSCCVLGAGPGAAFSYHGGGHGGRGGGYYQDHNTSRYYSWDYHDANYLLGGSTSTVLFDSKAGSGGGAIEIIATNGILNIDASIRANGFNSKNTSQEHCAGGSSGGLIRLKGNSVLFTEQGHLSARGGNSGFSDTTLKHCGDGGGGGVIQVFSTFDNNTQKVLQVYGGKGIDRGEEGVVFQGVFFNDGQLNINTSDCSMKWLSILVHQGVLQQHSYRTPDNKMKLTYHVCSFTFKSSLHIGSGAMVSVFGDHALKIVSEKGNIELMTSFDLNGTDSKTGAKSIGAFIMKNLNEKNVGPGNVTGCNAIDLFANDFETLLGGSVCGNSISNTPVKAVGGGAIELVSEAGTIVIGNTIKVNGFSDNTNAGATGGLIRLIGKKVHLKDKASFSAKSSDKGSNLATGGIVQIKSDMDIEGLCETKFQVTSARNGLVNVMVSAQESYQVQFIQEGTLLINTTLCIWVHRTHNNYSMAYSQFGSITNVTNNDIKFSICSFNFKPPIIVNGSANVTLTGDHALAINSQQGIYIGVDFVIDSEKVAGKSRYLGGFCVKETSLATTGNGPGRGQPNTNAGGGHGGRGGLFFEANNGKKYGYTYGIEHFLLIGGSTGTSNQSVAGIDGCGGGAIRISSQKNLTINAAVRANGYSAVMFNGRPHGGSSGGTIYLEAPQVILGDGALLEAKGSDAAGPGNPSTGGGGGGVIMINSTNPFIGNQPDPAVNTRGGQGLVPGESGVVIIKDVVHREQRNPVVEIQSNYSGCYRINTVVLPPRKKMFAHVARPKTCLLECLANTTLFAVIRNEFCYCLNKNGSFGVQKLSMCKQPCPATFNYSCGGVTDDIYSVYTTGVTLPVTQPPTTPTTEPTSTTMFTTTTRPPNQASTGLTELNQVNITKDNAQEVVKKLANLTHTTELNGGDTLAAVDIINKIASGNVLSPKNRNETKQTGQAIVETASRLLGNENEASWEYLETRNTTTRKTTSNNVLEAIEKIAINLGSGLDKEDNITIETDHVAMGIIKKNMATFTGDSYPHYDELSEKWQFGDKLFIPPETANAFKTREGEGSETTMYFVLYNRINNALKRNLDEGTVINSRVISVGFDRDLVNPLPKPVVISFTYYQTDNLTGPVCSFLDFSNKTSGDWSSHGVKTTVSDGMIKCESNHLTNFAVLMQVKKFEISKAHTQALQMITYIGCGISLFGLALTLATFLSLETLASERTSIHKNLVVAIGLAQIIFLAGIDVVYNPIACKIVALCLHYLYMAAFTWMCCEGLHLYTKVIEVFSSEASKMKYYYMLGWGVPLIIVIISAASRIDGYSTETACWISIDHGLIWAFVGPVLVIMCINFVVMVMVIKVILASVTSIQNPGNTSQVKAGLKGMVVLLPLLGLTWVFGLMAVNEKTIAFQYIFAILNSLQGLFIFAFHCIGNSEVRVAYKRLHEKRTLNKSLPEHSMSSGNHHREFNKRRMNSRETNSTGDEDIIVTKAIRSVSDVKLTGAGDHVAMQTFGDADSGRWSLNCPSPDPPCIVFQSATKDSRGNPRSAPDILDGPKATPRESYRSDGNYPTDRHRYRGGNQGNSRSEESSSTKKYQRF